MQPPHMQSQQSFTMSQQSQHSVGHSSMYRQYNDPGRQHGAENEMPIYSVGPDVALWGVQRREAKETAKANVVITLGYILRG